MTPLLFIEWAGAVLLWAITLCLIMLTVVLTFKMYTALKGLWKEIRQEILTESLKK